MTSETFWFPICMLKWCSLELQLGAVIIVFLKDCSCFIGNGVSPFIYLWELEALF